MMINTKFIRQVGLGRWATRYARLQFRKRILKADTHMRLPTGSTIVLPRHSPSATEVYLTDADIDMGSEALFARFADPRRDFIDVGAHIGYYAVYLAPLVRRAYAFEPDPRNLQSLRVNAERAGNVEVVQMAVSSKPGTAHLYLGRNSAVTSLGQIADATSVDVPMTSLDAFLSARSGIDPALIKTDIEGHDFDALRGMNRMVADHQPLILSECKDVAGFQDLVRGWKYRIFAFTRDRSTFRVDFREMSAADLQQAWFKMLFLVPPRLTNDFEMVRDDYARRLLLPPQS